MSQEADALAVQAEKKRSFILLAKSNAFRQKMHESEANEQSLCEQARTFKEKLKFMEQIKFEVIKTGLAENNSIKLGLVLFTLKNNIYCCRRLQAVLSRPHLILQTAFIAWGKSIISIIIL